MPTMVRERLIDGVASVADLCVRQGASPGIFLLVAPFRRLEEVWRPSLRAAEYQLRRVAVFISVSFVL